MPTKDGMPGYVTMTLPCIDSIVLWIVPYRPLLNSWVILAVVLMLLALAMLWAMPPYSPTPAWGRLGWSVGDAAKARRTT